MKATLYFLVEVTNDYNNYDTLSNGLEVMTNNTIESVENVNRIVLDYLSTPIPKNWLNGYFLITFI